MKLSEYIPGTHGGGILVDKDGVETHYTVEEWRHKEIVDKLDAIAQLLKTPSGNGKGD